MQRAGPKGWMGWGPPSFFGKTLKTFISNNINHKNIIAVNLRPLVIDIFIIPFKYILTMRPYILKIRSKRIERMKAIRQKVMIVFTATLLALGAATNSAALSETCSATKACGGKINTSPVTYHDRTGEAHNCTPILPTPCCHLKQHQPKMDTALTSLLQFSSHRFTMGNNILQELLPEPRLFAPPHCENERTRVPLVPIYLQTLVIRC